MAHKKGLGSTQNGRDSRGQRLGIKCYANEVVGIGSIIVRQRGRKFRPGVNVKRGRDDTLFSLIEGRVHFKPNRTVSVLPLK